VYKFNTLTQGHSSPFQFTRFQLQCAKHVDRHLDTFITVLLDITFNALRPSDLKYTSSSTANDLEYVGMWGSCSVAAQHYSLLGCWVMQFPSSCNDPS